MRVVSTLEAARGALNDGETALSTPAYAACHAGVNYYRALLDALKAEFPARDFSFTLCCGDDAAIAYDALTMGFREVLCDCADGQFAVLSASAQAMGARVLRPWHSC